MSITGKVIVVGQSYTGTNKLGNAGHKIERTGGTWASKYGTKIKEWDIAPPQ